MRTLTVILVAMALATSAGEMVPSHPPDGPWTASLRYGVRDTNGVYAWNGCSVRSDLYLMYASGPGGGRRGPPQYKISKEQAAALYKAAAKAANNMEIKPWSKGVPQSQYRVVDFSLTFGEQSVSFTTPSQEPSPDLISVIEKFRDVFDSIKPAVMCCSNLSRIDASKQWWMAVKHKTTNDVPSWEDLRPYYSGALPPNCSLGGTYTIGRLGVSPTCSVSEHSAFYRAYRP